MKLINNSIDYSLVFNIPKQKLISDIFLPIQTHQNNMSVAVAQETNTLMVQNYLQQNISIVIYPKEEILSILLYLEERIAMYSYYLNNKLEDMIKSIISLAILYRSSDIHIEPNISTNSKNTPNLCIIRYRINGMMYDIFTLPIDAINKISSRIKLFASIDIVQKRTPQNGRFTLNIADKKFDFRVSSMPLIEYESLVIRILGKYDIKPKLAHLGYSLKSLTSIQKVITKDFGLILVCGPTGSGKSTTLYSMLNHINNGTKKIITIEDPVEYNVANTQQIQIEPEIGLTYEIVLKNILRQDPDVIVIGEIRDKESLKTAIEASMTGHLVIATIHTNSVIEAISRLLEMGIDAYFIASSLRLITSGRLIKKSCKKCNNIGCKECNFTGYSGRTIAEETFEITPSFQNLISKKVSQNDLKEHLVKNGFSTIKDHIYSKIAQGDISKEDAKEVIERLTI